MLPLTRITDRPATDAESMRIEGVMPRVLIVDDEDLIRWSLAQTLLDQGYDVQTAGTGKAAIEAVNAPDGPFDVVLLDFRLPDSHDLGLLGKLRELMPRASVILMTAYTTPEVTQNALDLGAFRVVTKPLDIHDVQTLVKRAC
jgi:two-component system response regulator AtoC